MNIIGFVRENQTELWKSLEISTINVSSMASKDLKSILIGMGFTDICFSDLTFLDRKHLSGEKLICQFKKKLCLT